MYDKKSTLEVTDGEILGGKTGYTKAAGLCLASLAKVEGQEYILVTAGADENRKYRAFPCVRCRKYLQSDRSCNSK